MAFEDGYGLDVTVGHYPGVLSPAECAQVVEASRPYGREVWPKGGGCLVGHPVDDFADRLPAGVLSRLWRIVYDFNRRNGWRIPIDIGRAGVSLYRTGDFMSYHVDDEERGPYPWDVPHRGVSMSIPLSDRSDYAGGGLVLYDDDGGEVVTATPGRGDAVVFGSSVPHEVGEVTEGERWVLLFWAYTNHTRRPIA